MKKIFFFTLILMAILAGCHKNHFKVNTSEVEVKLNISRFETELFSADPSLLENKLQGWNTKYSPFFQHFNEVMRLGDWQDPLYPARLRLFVTDPLNYKIYKRTLEVFPNLDTFAIELTNAFRHYKYYFPDKPIPRIITYVSGFNQTAITDSALLAIGLDKYLGSNEDLYRKVEVYNYLLVNMVPAKIPSDCMRFWAETEFAFNDSINNLVCNMIYEGKLMYFVYAMLPDEADTTKWGFNNRQLDFCRKNEKSMWTYLIEQKLLFKSDRFTIDKFIHEGPFTKDFSRESPARAAVWLGFRIVSSYMDEHPGITLKEMMLDDDYLRILNASDYNP